MSKKTIEFSLEGKEAKPSPKPKVANGEDRKRRTNLMNKIKAYQKHNQIEVSTAAEDFDSDFKGSLQFLDNLSKTRKRRQHGANRKTQRAAEPKYGNLKNGSKPTYRQLEQSPLAPGASSLAQGASSLAQGASAPQVVSLAPGASSLAPGASSLAQGASSLAPGASAPQVVSLAQGASAPQVASSLAQGASAPQVASLAQGASAPQVASSLAPAAQVPPPSPLKRSKSIKYHLGKRQDKVGVLIKNRKTRKRIETEDKHLAEKDLAEMRSHLIERNLYKAGSAAPNDVIRQLYRQSILAGDVSNKNGSTLVHNYMS